MKKIKAYTLMEMLVVMSIMIILLAVGFNAYASFTETTKYNQDVNNLQQDILIIQRAAMLLERDASENWPYGIGIDFNGIRSGTGEYKFFKWCSVYSDFGSPPTRGQYPHFVQDSADFEGNMSNPILSEDTSSCVGLGGGATDDILIPLTGYSSKNLSLGEDVSITSDIRFLLFESVSGRAFVYDVSGNRIEENLEILFEKNFGPNKILQVDYLIGRSKIIEEP